MNVDEDGQWCNYCGGMADHRSSQHRGPKTWPATAEQVWMASDLQSAMGYAPDAGPSPALQVTDWADWWDRLLTEVRETRRERDARELLDEPR